MAFAITNAREEPSVRWNGPGIAKKAKPARLLWTLLALHMLASLVFLVVNLSALHAERFPDQNAVEWPFTVAQDGATVATVTPEARQGGLSPGDVIESLNGEKYRGFFHFLEQAESAYPGDQLWVQFRSPDGSSRSVQITLVRFSAPPIAAKQWLNTLEIAGILPLVCLLAGCWVIASQPGNPNAWLILLQLSFAQILLTSGSWPVRWLAFMDGWSSAVRVLALTALLCFGFSFPQRNRVDRKLPFLKVIVAAGLICIAALELWAQYGRDFQLGGIYKPLLQSPWLGRVSEAARWLCVGLFGFAIFDQTRPLGTASQLQRARLLCAGSAVGFFAYLVFFRVLARFGTGPALPGLGLGLLETLLLFFYPIALVYVFVARTPLNVRTLARMAARFSLSGPGLEVLRGVSIATLLFVIVSAAQQESMWSAAVGIAGLMLLVVLLYSPLVPRVSRWLSGELFGEVQRSEQMLDELADEVRHFVEAGRLLETVIQRIGQALQSRPVAVLLYAKGGFRLEYSAGLEPAPPLWLSEKCLSVRSLIHTNRPVPINRDRPDGWLLLADQNERQVLDAACAELLVPLPGRRHMMGILALGPKESKLPYSPLDMRFLYSVGIQTGLALEVSELAVSLAQEAAQKERVQREIEIAREVQERLFPQAFPVLNGATLAGACRPALQVGGDYYDVIQLEDGIVLAVGDVAGKGVSASLLMASLQAALRGITLGGVDNLAGLMCKLNHLIYESSSSSRYATFFLAVYNPRSNELRYVNAGHNPPLLLRRTEDGSLVRRRLAAGGMVLGLIPDVRYLQESLALQPGDMLLGYTDGITEAMTSEEEEWGEDRAFSAAEAAYDATAAAIVSTMFGAVDDFTAVAPQHDDMTLLVLKLERSTAIS